MQRHIDSRRHLRREATKAESVLWEALRARRLDGHKFRRQHPIAGFVADFCCTAARLIVEVDGPIHRAQEDADAARDEVLAHRGYRSIRFTNDDVLRDVESVVARIREALRG